jgi:flagellar protein FlbD
MRLVGDILDAQAHMIQLTRINRVPLVLNSDLIEHIEVTPDTVITLTNGQKFLVLESPDEVIERIVQFRRQIFASLPRMELRDVPA